MWLVILVCGCSFVCVVEYFGVWVFICLCGGLFVSFFICLCGSLFVCALCLFVCVIVNYKKNWSDC